MTTPIRELLVAFGAVLLALLLLNPWGLYMPSMLVEVLCVGLYILFAVFVIFVWRERARDEREEAIRMRVGRMSYLATTTVLVIGIVFEALTDHPDFWLVLGLVVAILAKTLGGYFYNSKL